MAWPVRQVEVVSFPADDKKTQELPQRSQQESERTELHQVLAPGAQEGAERSWWRRVFGG
jgi:hypothetical protein